MTTEKILEPTFKVLPKRNVTQPANSLDSFKNPRPGRNFTVEFKTEEFTCLCPMTGQPDFAHIKIIYVPNKLCVESKSLKLYLWNFRNKGAFHEEVVNQILDDLIKTLEPKWILIEGNFLIRGGINTTVIAEYGNK